MVAGEQAVCLCLPEPWLGFSLPSPERVPDTLISEPHTASGAGDAPWSPQHGETKALGSRLPKVALGQPRAGHTPAPRWAEWQSLLSSQ